MPVRWRTQGASAAAVAPRPIPSALEAGSLQFPVFVGGVTVVGLALLVAVLRYDPIGAMRQQSPTFFVIALLLLVAELVPLRLLSTDGRDEQRVTASDAFTFALLIMSGTAVVIVVQSLASLVSDLIARRIALWKALFNVANYALALACAGAVLETYGRTAKTGAYTFAIEDLPGIFLAAATFFIVNHVLVSASWALYERKPLIDQMREGVVLEVSTSGISLAVAPVLVVAGEAHPTLVLLLLLPMIAVYRSALMSIESQRRALLDELTGLPNRSALSIAVRSAIERGTPGALLVADLNRFREVNETLGRDAGDEILRQVAGRLVETAGAGAVVSRVSADDFAILITGHTNVLVAWTLQGVLEKAFDVADLRVNFEAAIGVALLPDDGGDFETLSRRADLALRAAKERGTGVEGFAGQMESTEAPRLTLLGDLRDALDAGSHQIVLHYQPKVDPMTGEVRGCEALVRWNHPERGMVPPGEFIPLVEHTSLVHELALRVLFEAIRQQADWRSRGIDISVAVNLSARNLTDLDLPGNVSNLLNQWQVPASKLVLEITESTLMADPERALDVLSRLDSLGVKLSIDDFGTGYSSLAYLKRLPVKELKIDRSFVAQAAEDEGDAKIVRSTIDLARQFGLQVVAEGVEDARTIALLAYMGCDLVQGYFVSRPLPADAFLAWLLDRQPATA
ncbi:MAG: putative bifunctional diguanylate cyclase/phosphodiesterase, partial [Acidimicrobiia bacterium]